MVARASLEWHSAKGAFPASCQSYIPLDQTPTSLSRTSTVLSLLFLRLLRGLRRVGRWRGPGRTEARSGLRMMPTFLSSFLRCRTAGFPQYGSKAGMSNRACPNGTRSVCHLVCLCPSCTKLAALVPPHCAGEHSRLAHHRSSGFCRSTPGTLAPVQVTVSWSILTYWPQPPHSQPHLDFAARRFIRDALAVRHTLNA